MAGCSSPDHVGETSDSESGTTGVVDADGGANGGSSGLPARPSLELEFSQVDQFDFSWGPTFAADYYQLMEQLEGGAEVQLGDDLLGESVSLRMPLHLRANASYVLRACNDAGCQDSERVEVGPAIAEAIGYFKASDPDEGDLFGSSIAISADGSTLAVAAIGDDSNAIGIDGDSSNNSAIDAGAVYVFRRGPGGDWVQDAYVKPSNPNAGDQFGWRVALSAEGDTLAVSAIGEDSSALGIAGNQADNAANEAGAVYLFEHDMLEGWAQLAYVKPSNTDANDGFGSSLALSADGMTLAVGAIHEASDATGIDGNPLDDSANGAGAAYVFVSDAAYNWTQQAYVKASNTGPNDAFGIAVALSADGDTLAVGAMWEDGSAPGIDGDQDDNLTTQAGAVYLFSRDELDAWAQRAYVKPSNPGAQDEFGEQLTLSAEGDRLAVGAHGEDSSANTIDGDQANDFAPDAGAVYVFALDELDAWTQQAYVKAINTEAGDQFGSDVEFSADGRSLAIGASMEDSNALGLEGDGSNDAAIDSGAAYLFQFDSAMGWQQRTYIKPPNTGSDDSFGESLALSGDAQTLAITSLFEDGIVAGIGGIPSDDSALDVGATYVY